MAARLESRLTIVPGEILAAASGGEEGVPDPILSVMLSKTHQMFPRRRMPWENTVVGR